MTAFLGMGLLGSNFVRALRKRGEPVSVWNRTSSRAQALAETGAQVFLSPADAVRGALWVHLVLKDDAAVDEVLEAVLPGLEKGSVIIDHTTTTSEGAGRRAALWAGRGFPYLHAPVFMGPKNALESSGTMLASGDKELFDRVAVHLSSMTGSLKWVGADPGKGAALKLVGNSLILTLSAGLTDVISLANTLGIDQNGVNHLFDDLGVASWIPTRLQRLYQSDPSSPTWELQMARKDAGIMLKAAETSGRPLMVIPALCDVMDKLITQGDGALDYTVISREVR